MKGDAQGYAMDSDWFGNEGTTPEDRGYAGSRFSDVQKAIFDDPYQPVWGAPGAPPLPQYKSTLHSLLAGILPWKMRYQFRAAAERTLESGADLRWGHNRKGFRRLIHPNGICLTGRWEITADTPYTGYFRKGSRALVVARYSTCCDECRRGHSRSLSMVGKLFPTDDPDHREPVRTANFILQHDIGGIFTDFINDVELRNAADVTALRRGSGIWAFAVTGIVLRLANTMPTIRQLYQVAELGKPSGTLTRAPQFMHLLMDGTQPRILGDALDFRDEIMAQIYDRGDPAPKRTLTFNIEVTDHGESYGSVARQRWTFRKWRTIGTVIFDRAAASYNGDHVLHFNHPIWREDRNDPATATRVDE
jgi:hypothetical protein